MMASALDRHWNCMWAVEQDWNGASGLGLAAAGEKLGKKISEAVGLARGFGGFSAWGFPQRKI